MKSIASAVSVIALAAAVSAADVSGTWDVNGDVQGHPVVFACELTQEGETLSGTAKLDVKDVPITGSVTENSVSFEFDATDEQGTTHHLVFSGTVGEDGGMTGTIAVSGAEGYFTAKKQ
jgi:hypothetical protein